MLASHLSLARVMTGETDDAVYRMVYSPTCENELLDSANMPALEHMKPYYTKEYIQNKFLKPDRNATWDAVKSAYIAEWRKNPDVMAETKILQWLNFYTLGRPPLWFEHYLTQRHPHLQTLVERKHARPEEAASLQARFIVVERERGVVALLLALLFCLRYGKKIWPERLRELLIRVALLTMAYVLSFLAVTPTLDYRYTSYMLIFEAMVLSFCCLGFVALSLRSCRHKKVMENG